MPEMYTAEWVEKANELLAVHDTGVVPEFDVCLEVRVEDDRPLFWLRNSGSRLSFTLERPAPPDCTVNSDSKTVRAAFDYDDQMRFMDELFRSAPLDVRGDLAKGRFFLTGLVRKAPVDLVASLRALG